MKDGKMTRREAMERLVTVIALASGLSVSKVKDLLAQTKPKTLSPQTPKQAQPTVVGVKQVNLQQVAGVRPSNQLVKLLKALIHNDKSVFENEFGRVTPKFTVKDVHAIPPAYINFLKGKTAIPGMGICPTEFGGGAMHGICGTYVFGDFSGIIEGAGTGSCNFCQSEGGDCSGTSSLSCDGLNCGNAVCTGHLTCSGNTCTDAQQTNIVTPAFLDRYKADPYIASLFQVFRVTTSQALAQEIQNLLNQRRQVIAP